MIKWMTSFLFLGTFSYGVDNVWIYANNVKTPLLEKQYLELRTEKLKAFKYEWLRTSYDPYSTDRYVFDGLLSGESEILIKKVQEALTPYTFDWVVEKVVKQGLKYNIVALRKDMRMATGIRGQVAFANKAELTAFKEKYINSPKEAFTKEDWTLYLRSFGPLLINSFKKAAQEMEICFIRAYGEETLLTPSGWKDSGNYPMSPWPWKNCNYELSKIILDL